MQTKEYHTTDKTLWGPGPWQKEPDKRQWLTAAGMPGLIVRNLMTGNLCGYAGVALGHPMFGKDTLDHDDDSLLRLIVHGGITFTGLCTPHEDESRGICHKVEPGEPDKVWWLGFDCGHRVDVSPRMKVEDPEIHALTRSADAKYRDLAYVTAQVEKLAAQLKAM